MILGKLPACDKDVWAKSIKKEQQHFYMVDDELIGGDHAQAKKFRIFFDWLLKGGGKCPKLYLRYYSNNYRAINARGNIYAEEDILYVPHDLVMTSEVARKSRIGQEIINSGLVLRSRHSFIAAYLLQEKKKPDSYWKPYIDILPEKYDTVPLFFSEEQLQLLEGSMAINKIDDRHQSLKLEYNNICAKSPSFTCNTYQEFVWARLVVITRIFGMVIDNVKTEGLVPMADMLNHKRPRQTKWTYVQARRGFVITSLQPIGRNLEVFDSYGRKCNSRFFINYGFVPEANEDNEAIVSFSLDPEDAAFKEKKGLSGSRNLEIEKCFQIPMQYDDINNKVKECFSYLRFLVASKQELQNYFPIKESFRINEIWPISPANEQRVLKAMSDAAKNTLSGFPDSLEHDEKLLKDHEAYPKFANCRNIILMRRGEKAVLQHFVDLAKICIPLLEMTPDQIQDYQQRNKIKPIIKDYIKDVVLYVVT